MLRIDRDRESTGRLLVAAQFCLITILAFFLVRSWNSPASFMLSIATMLPAVVIGVLAISTNRPGNFNIHPRPRDGATIVRHGIYRWIRHPMYGALLAAALACVLADKSAWSWLSFFALVAVLRLKAELEERWLSESHPEYVQYMTMTKRFIPFVY